MRRIIEHLSCYRGAAGHPPEKYSRAFSLLVFAGERMAELLFLKQGRTRCSCLRRV
jgi:hypothetical protein